MKIAIVCPYPLHTSGGVQRHILDFYAQLKKRGHYVKLISPSDKMDMEDHISLGVAYTVKGGKYIANNSETFYPRTKQRKPILPESFDIIHVHEPMLLPPFYYGIKIARHNPAQYVAHIHAMNPAMFEQFKFFSIPLLRRKMKIFNRIIATSKYSAKPYLDSGFKVDIIPNGVEISKLSPDVPKAKEYQDGKKNLMFLGRSDERKGLKYLLQSWPKFVKKYGGNVRLIIAGGRSEEEVELMKSWADGLPQRENIIFEGGVSEERKAQLFSTADVYISPATGSESFGMVLNESMAAGTPVVAFDNPGYRTVLDGKMEYCMATLFDVEELFQKVVRILEDEKLRNELSEWGLAEVRDKYDWNKVTDRVLKVYNEIVVPAKAVA